MEWQGVDCFVLSSPVISWNEISLYRKITGCITGILIILILPCMHELVLV